MEPLGHDGGERWQPCECTLLLGLSRVHGVGPGSVSDETQSLAPKQKMKWSLLLTPLSLFLKIAVIAHDALESEKLEVGSLKKSRTLPTVILCAQRP